MSKASNTKKNDKLYLVATVAVIALAVGAIVYKGNKNEDKDFFKDAKSDQETETVKEDLQNSYGTSVGSYIEGTLSSSENPDRGNLRVVSKFGDIYIRTTKDFSALIGSNIIMTIEGTLDNFRLVDIKKKVVDGGYILSE